MDDCSLVFGCVLVLVLFMALRIYNESDAFQLKCILSDVNGEKYCVRDNARMQEAADLLAKTTEKCKQLIVYCMEKYPTDEKVIRLATRFDPSKISETLPNSEFVAYSENKGEKIAFCLNQSKTNQSRLIDENTLLFVALHEMSHVMTIQEGHKQEFWTNFKFLLTQAKQAGIYQPQDYKRHPVDYCGMKISDNPLFDL